MNLPTPEEALAGMARVGSPRVPMGNSAIPNPVVVPPLRGELVSKAPNSKGGTDTGGPSGHRNAVPQESLGASYRVKAVTPPMTSPEAGPTTANGKIVPSSLPRADSFGDALQGAYAGY